MKKFYTLLITAIFGFAFSQNTVNFTGETINWQFPPLVTTAQVSAWGGGGAGGATTGGNNTKVGAGGGGGAFAMLNAMPVNPSTIYSGVAGPGGVAGSGNGGNGTDSWFNSNTMLLAKGGSGGGSGGTGTYGVPGSGGLAISSIGDVMNSGGNASRGTRGSYSGAGGGSAGSIGNGGDATAGTGGTAGSGALPGANGANARTSRNNGLAGSAPGSGGSGGYGNNNSNYNGGNGADGVVAITYTGYCRPFSTNNGTYINALSTTGGVTNISKSTTGYGAYGYQNWYYDSNGSVSAYEGNTFTVTFNLVAGTFGAGVAIWIDWNKNNSFDASERVYNSAAYLATGNTTTPAITVPVGTTAGDYVMRIVTDYWSMNPDSCTLNASGPRGEGEDYKLTVLAAPACSGIPVGGTVTVNPTSGTPGSTYSVSATGYSNNATGLTYQWQYSDDNGASWLNQGTSSTTYSGLTGMTPYGAVRQWRLAVTCSNSASTGYSTLGTFTTTYCVSSGDTFPDGITGVQFNTISNLNTPVNTAYTNYTNISTTVMKTLQYDLRVYVNTGGNYIDYQSVYFDWNGDGDFADAGEFYNLGTASNVTNGLTSLSPLSITIPAGAITGSVRMRVQSRYNSATTGPCQTGFYGEVEDYTINIINAVACSGTPTGGTTVLTPNTGTPNSTFTASVTGATVASGLTYQWESAPTATGPWTDIAGATTATATITAINTFGTTYYRRKISCGINSAWSTVVSYTTDYCTPSSTASDFYIKNVQFVGTLNPDTTNPSGYTAGGYANYKAKPEIAKQLVGEAINVQLSLQNTVANPYSYAKAWVDWNRDGFFNNDASEIVYDSGTESVADVPFGYIIPTGTAPGTYVIRIRNRYADSNGNNFDPCEILANGETEDYTFEVINPCAAQITSVSAPSNCGAGPVTITAVGNSSTTSYKWFSSEFGAAISGENGSTYTTGSLTPGSYTYYVSAVGASCEAQFRTPVKIVVKPKPNVQFTQTAPEICGSGGTIQIATSNVSEEVTLIDDHFDNLSNFVNSFDGNTEPTGAWQLYNGPHRFPNYGPAVSSGYGGGQFAAVTTDVQRNSNFLNYFSSSSNLPSTANFTTLKMDFDLYLYFEQQNNVNRGYFKVQYSTNGGAAWNDIADPNAFIMTNVGVPTRWSKISINLPAACLGQNQLRFRFVAFAYSSTSEWMVNLFAIDNVRIYGDRPLVPNFTWTGDTSILFQSDCTSAITSSTTSLCIKPSATQIENDASWTVNVSSTLSNSCNATGTITIPNASKTWSAASNDWSVPADWKPSGVPDATKCVIIKSPVTINSLTSDYQAFAKKVKIEAPGTLTVKSNAIYASSLTVSEEFINNNTAENSVVLENNTSLKQLSGSTGINHGNITVHRNLDFTGARNEYNYLSTPVTFASGQSYKTIYPGVTSANYPSVLYYVESTRYFLQSSGANILGRSSAVKEAGTLSGITNNRAEFKGVPYVGDFTYPLAHSSTGLGFNLVGNPYPSNVDLQVLYSYNSSQIEPDFRFWDNKANDNGGQQHGAGYNGRAYARYNAVSNIGNEAGYYLNTSHPIIGSKKPNKILKVGQGMMVQALGSGKSLSWNNAPDVKTVDNAGSVFFGKTSPDNRYWLTMKTPENLILTAAFTYIPELSNAFEKGDSKVTSGESDSFYSMTSDAEKVVINARSIFNPDDVVPLGTTHYAAGSYTISLGDHEGIFANGQNVYLKDKELNIVTNLSEGPYSFTSNSGQFTNRFEIVYLPQTTLDVTGFNKESVQIYRDGEDFVVKASTKNIKDVELYEMSGKLIFKKSSATREVRINAAQLANGIYMVKAYLENGEVTTKKVRY